MTRTPEADRPATKPNARGRRSNPATRLTTTRVAAKRGKSAADKQPRGAEVRERVLQAALECFGAFGFAGTSTRAVAERAGVSHPLLLYHFGSKDQLWRSTMEEVIGRYSKEVDTRLAEAAADGPVAGLRAFVDTFVRFSAQTPQLHRIMTQQSTQGSERIDWLIDNYLRDSFKAVCTLIRRGQRTGAVRKGDPARLYYAVIGLAGTLFSVSREFQQLTGRDVFAAAELRKTTEMIFAFLLV